MTTRQAKRLREGDQVRHADGTNGSVITVSKTLGLFEIIWDDEVTDWVPFNSAESISLARGD